MRRSTVTHWKTLPGRYDELRQSPEFGVPVSKNLFGIPDALCQASDWLQGQIELNRSIHRYAKGTKPSKNGIVHFFTDDYRFEQLWSKPWAGLKIVQQWGAVFAPDFSMYPEWPAVANMWNLYRSRWLMRFWQQHGVTVYPTVSWATGHESWIFEGLPTGIPVAVSAPSQFNGEELHRWESGFSRMLTRVQPKRLVVYGKQDAVYEYLPPWVRVLYVTPTRIPVREKKPVLHAVN